jgi:hypothetical protein
VVRHRHSKVLGLKGKRQISALQAAERGALITVVTCMSPTGNYVPPLLIFPRKNMKIELMNCTPPVSIYACLCLVGSKVISLQTGSDTLFVTLNQQQKIFSSLFWTVTSLMSITSKSSI